MELKIRGRIVVYGTNTNVKSKKKTELALIGTLLSVTASKYAASVLKRRRKKLSKGGKKLLEMYKVAVQNCFL